MNFIMNLYNNNTVRVLLIFIVLDTVLRDFKGNKRKENKFGNWNRRNYKKNRNVNLCSIFKFSGLCNSYQFYWIYS